MGLNLLWDHIWGRPELPHCSAHSSAHPQCPAALADRILLPWHILQSYSFFTSASVNESTFNPLSSFHGFSWEGAFSILRCQCSLSAFPGKTLLQWAVPGPCSQALGFEFQFQYTLYRRLQEPQLPYMKVNVIMVSVSERLSCVLNGLTHVKHLAECLACRKSLLHVSYHYDNLYFY